MVPAARLELARPHQALDFESNASTDSTTRACVFLKRERIIEVEQGIFNHAFQETRRTGFWGISPKNAENWMAPFLWGDARGA